MVTHTTTAVPLRAASNDHVAPLIAASCCVTSVLHTTTTVLPPNHHCFSRLCHTSKAASIHHCSSTSVLPRCSVTTLLHTPTTVSLNYFTFIAVPGCCTTTSTLRQFHHNLIVEHQAHCRRSESCCCYSRLSLSSPLKIKFVVAAPFASTPHQSHCCSETILLQPGHQGHCSCTILIVAAPIHFCRYA